MAYIELLIKPISETFFMVGLSTLFAVLLGLPFGVLLVVTDANGIHPNKKIYTVLSALVNLTRSIPFIILMILLFPLSRLIVGTTIGTIATIVPLSVGAAPFMGRLVESSLKEVNKGIVEAVKSMGASDFEIIVKVLLPEALPSLIRGITMLMINLIGYSAMAGAIGGGGLGHLAIRYGYHRSEYDVLIISVIVIVLIVQIIQGIGNLLANRVLAKR